MRSPTKQLELVDICEGCKLVHDGVSGIVVGVPNEVRKFIDNAGYNDIKVPAYIAPDTPHANGLSYWRYEFPGFTKMFKEGGYFKGEKLTILGDADQLKYGQIIIRSSLLSLTEEELDIGRKRFGATDKEIDDWQRIINYFSLKKLDDPNTTVDITDLFDFVELTPDKLVNVGQFWIQKHRKLNTYTIGHKKFRQVTFTLTFKSRPKPPYRIEVSDAFQEKFALGGVPFSYGNGFDPRNGNTNWLIKINGVEILWDVGSFIWDHLLANGYGPHRVYNLYVSHGHEDHVGAMLGAIYYGGQFNIYGTPLVLVSTMVNFFANFKWDIGSDKNWRRIRQYFTFYPLQENQTRSLFGADFTPKRSYHTVPTAGALIEVYDNGRQASMYVTSDITGAGNLKKMYTDNIIPNSEYTDALELINGAHTLKICDGGGDPDDIHMSPQEWQEIAEQSGCFDTKFVVGHRNELPASCNRLTLAEPGKPYVACFGDYTNADSSVFADAIRTLGVDDRNQVEVLWNQSTTLRFGSRYRLMKEDERTDSVYIVLAGTLEVLANDENGDEHRIAILQSGDYFGEMAYLLNTGRNASIRSISSIRVRKFSGNCFARFVWENDLHSKLVAIWSKRNLIAKISYFQCLSAEDLKQLASESKLVSMPGGNILIQEGAHSDSVYGIVSGHVNVIRTVNGKKKLLNVLGSGAIIGETSVLNEAETRNATVQVKGDSTFIKFEGDDFRRWVGKRFGLYIGIKTLIEERELAEQFNG